ncbi:mucin-1 isoform 8 precursor [Homo sapiens]|uniref:mucin-1 isoform 8 precursor n=1 Tax=Homo sapiens TaxID=9606 RepID=UPI0000DD5A49|nr:mucin-1 isoform 8 precursor [Homo sapiens]XP_055217246.1 mucin-1 isoform X12 [Gorilla gorilla gorilla]|eukprot:NP_001037858.1 mucin-1 isoform 8 precursor [Homo sapiens]
MTPGTQSPFFLLLLLTVLTVVTGSGHASSTPGGEKETSATQRSSVPSSTEKNAIPAPTTTKSCRETFLKCFCRFINKGVFWASPILSSVWGWGARLGHRAAGAGLCSGCAGHCLSHCLGCLSVPPKELRAAGHLSSPGYLPSYERVPHLPHPWALCAP